MGMQEATPKIAMPREIAVPQAAQAGLTWKQPTKPVNRMNSMPNIGDLNLGSGSGSRDGRKRSDGSGQPPEKENLAY